MTESDKEGRTSENKKALGMIVSYREGIENPPKYLLAMVGNADVLTARLTIDSSSLYPWKYSWSTHENISAIVPKSMSNIWRVPMASNDSGNSVMVSLDVLFNSKPNDSDNCVMVLLEVLFNNKFLYSFSSGNNKNGSSCCLSSPDVFERKGTKLQTR